jgi:hypothetical protein
MIASLLTACLPMSAAAAPLTSFDIILDVGGFARINQTVAPATSP